MEDHHHHYQPQQYHVPTDLRNFVNAPIRSTAPHFPTVDLFPGHHQQQQYEMMMLMPRGLHDFASASTPPLSSSGLDGEAAPSFGGDASTGRWPRQETLTLLEVRSHLDPKFKEANQKGPLWDEVSRIMSEEHGYQRSGKKCREKFENLYKYYKKTREGKAGRHDGKHYRFFRQLEALYGDQNSINNPANQEMFQPHHHNNNNKQHCDHNSLSLTNSTEFDTSSSDDENENDHSIEESEIVMKRKRSRRNWKVKIKDFLDLQMKKLVEKQEEWLEKIVKTMEEKEKERLVREEEWRKQEEKRLEKEQRFWAKERAWIEARDASLMEALQNVTGNSLNYFNNNNDHQQSCLYNQGSDNYCDINDQRKENVGKMQSSDDGSSPSNFNVGNFPFLMSEGGNWWESYGLKLSKANPNH